MRNLARHYDKSLALSDALPEIRRAKGFAYDATMIGGFYGPGYGQQEKSRNGWPSQHLPRRRCTVLSHLEQESKIPIQ